MAWLPFSITFGRLGRAELLLLAGALLIGAAAVPGAMWLRATLWPPPPAPPVVATVSLAISSTPSGAAVLVDDQSHGPTPVTLDVVPGTHTLTLQAPEAIPETRRVAVGADGAALDVTLWRARPTIHYLKPTLPGGSLTDARFLDDGRLGLVLQLPGGERQAWTVDPAAHVAAQRLGEAAARAPLATRPDGQAVAVLRPRAEAPGGRAPAFLDHVPAGEVWLVPTGAGATPRWVWTVPEPAEELVDLEWAPDGAHLLVVGRQPVAGGASRTVIHSLDVERGQAEDLALLPSEVASGSSVWSAEGQTVAFVVHTASLATVCTLSVAGDFHYLGDLGHDGLLGPPVAPVAWGSDGRVLYGALLGQAPCRAGGLSGGRAPPLARQGSRP